MVSFTYTITDKMGIHARPAGVMVQNIKKLPCNIKIKCGEREADAKKIFDLMAMGIKCGETVTVTVDGENEESVKEYLVDFFKNNF